MIKKKDIQTVFTTLQKQSKPTMLEQLSNYTHFQLLIATLLSARTKDTTTIPIVKKLFKTYTTPQHFIDIKVEKLENALYGIGFYKTKARNIQKLSMIILKKFHNTVPDTIEELISFPGVGRKTANCMLCYAFHKPAIAVDVHVHRISNRLGWIKTKTPEETENALMKLIPKESWHKINSLFVDHGQRVCFPINPNCKRCSIVQYCTFGKTKVDL
ncbi:DNA lyase [Candidatus Woesearchaeota archaeon CG10_big_fil_rev_8_21_14_0_10_36_11]|nr:MAG: DNA lyase [Candidatus Woesearchaeota archaeon CG10_big_fil_rev_8_21_14_0_10_36_11]